MALEFLSTTKDRVVETVTERPVLGWVAGAVAVVGLGVAWAGGPTKAKRAVVRTGEGFWDSVVLGKSREQQVLEYVFAHAVEGDAESVLKAMDDFAREHRFLMNVGDEKGLIVREEVRKAKPKFSVEIGGYCGYSAVLIGSAVREFGGRLVSIEVSPFFAAIATKIVEFAGLRDVVRVVVGPAKTRVPRLCDDFGIRPGGVDFLFVDHWKELYVPDLKVVESAGLLHRGSVVIGDNILFPGAPEFVEYVQNSGGYDLRIVESHLEYAPTTKDALAIAIRR